MSAKAIVGVGLAAAALGVVIGFGFGRSATPVPPMAQPVRDAELTATLTEVVARLTAVERALGERALGERATLVREPAKPTDNEAAVSPFDAEALVERLTALAQDLSVLRTDREHEALRRARDQNPQTNEAAVRVLHAAVVAESELPLPQRTVHRELLLRTMAEVVARLGMPTDVYTGGEAGPVWGYLFDDEELNLSFRDGLVVDVSD